MWIVYILLSYNNHTLHGVTISTNIPLLCRSRISFFSMFTFNSGITAIECAEMQPPFYEMHPMKMLYMMTKSSYRSPALKQKSKWWVKFNCKFLLQCSCNSCCWLLIPNYIHKRFKSLLYINYFLIFISLIRLWYVLNFMQLIPESNQGNINQEIFRKCDSITTYCLRRH